MSTPLVATEPLCSIAEADVYFDPANNHLYVDEWWATGSGSKASLEISFLYDTGLGYNDTAHFTIQAKQYGVGGNLISFEMEDSAGPLVFIGDNEILVHPEFGTSTIDDIITALEADDDFNDIATITCPTGEEVAVITAEYPMHFLQGGIDPDASTSGFKAGALAFATRKINNMPFSGRKVSPTQANAFPRKYTQVDGTEHIQTEVPLDVRYACCEEALSILKYGNSTRYKLQAQGVSGFGWGNQGLRESFVGSKEGDLLSGECMNLLRRYMRRNWIMYR